MIYCKSNIFTCKQSRKKYSWKKFVRPFSVVTGDGVELEGGLGLKLADCVPVRPTSRCSVVGALPPHT